MGREKRDLPYSTPCCLKIPRVSVSLALMQPYIVYSPHHPLDGNNQRRHTTHQQTKRLRLTARNLDKARLIHVAYEELE